MRIDLHAHTTCSDGHDSPQQLIESAAAAGLDIVALTDHDTTSGWGPAAHALAAGAGNGRVSVVPGAELSCLYLPEDRPAVSLHLLGYLFDPADPELVAEQRRLREQRRTRLASIAERMAADGFGVQPQRLLDSLPESTTVGRPHLARALMEQGVVASVDEAFRRFLYASGPYHLPKDDTPVERAIAMVSAAGGVSVLAHAWTARGGAVLTESDIAHLAAAGLHGIEVDHPDHDERTRMRLGELATGLGLIRTGSSDYHGANKVNRLGQHMTAVQEWHRLRAAAGGAVSELVGVR